jgi:hypothetical protein
MRYRMRVPNSVYMVAMYFNSRLLRYAPMPAHKAAAIRGTRNTFAITNTLNNVTIRNAALKWDGVSNSASCARRHAAIRKTGCMTGLDVSGVTHCVRPKQFIRTATRVPVSSLSLSTISTVRADHAIGISRRPERLAL